jgi:RNA polymerase sigma factor (sigma-70 family)
MIGVMDANRIAGELAGLHRLARSLAGGDANDLIQDAAVDALARPPGDVDDTRPLAPWLAAVVRNRWRMTRRGQARRLAREQAAVIGDEVAAVDDPLDRARALARLADALVALDEPFRAAIIARYFDGESAADMARRLGVPAGTVRWRVKTGLARLRARLEPRTLRAIAPVLLLRGAAVTTKTKLAIAAAVVIAAALAGGYAWQARGGDAAVATGSGRPAMPALHVPTPAAVATVPVAAPPSQARARVGDLDGGGVVRGRVIDWSRGDGVDGAELVFASDAGALTVHSSAGGAFEVAPGKPGELVLVAATKPGYLPYAPEYGTSPVRLHVVAARVVDGVAVFLYPALDYHGVVTDGGKPVAGAVVKLLGTPEREQVLDKLPTEWTTDANGEFTFHASDNAVLEATRGARRGTARLDGNVAVSHRMVIELSDRAPRDATIAGVVVDASGAPIADAIVRADPDDGPRLAGVAVRATAFATSGADGSFAIANVDRGAYTVSAAADGFAPGDDMPAIAPARAVRLVLDAGAQLTGTVVTTDRAAVPSFTLLVFRKVGAGRELVVSRSIVDAGGAFAVRVEPGDYELTASATGWAPSALVPGHPGQPAELVVTPGATLSGTVVSAATGQGLQYARVTRESRGGGASAAPANTGVVTDGSGGFVLAGIPPGPLSITVGAGDFDPKIVSVGAASDGDALGPVTVEMSPIAPGAEPKIEVIGIGVALAADGNALRVDRVIAGGGAAAAGIVVGDEIVSVDGASAADLGVDGAVAKIRGVEGTTVAIGLQRKGEVVVVQCVRVKLRA